MDSGHLRTAVDVTASSRERLTPPSLWWPKRSTGVSTGVSTGRHREQHAELGETPKAAAPAPESPSQVTDVSQAGLSEMDDTLLLRHIADGDRKAFRCFYDRHSGKVYAVLNHLCRERVVVDDALQEVFLAVWRAAATYRPERGAATGWLYTITRNKAFDIHRRRKAEVRVEDAEVFVTPEIDTQAPGPELRITLGQALEGLDDGQRDALRLAYFGGYSYAETAHRLRLPLGTVKSRISTALRRLKSILSD